jgi:hypothetical protein
MTYEQTLEKMRTMHLSGMAQQFQKTYEVGFQKLTPDELATFTGICTRGFPASLINSL